MSDTVRPVTTIAHEWIPLPDGRRLASRRWIPSDLGRDQVPAVFEFHPYGKGGPRAVWESGRNAYVASRGYAVVRADLAGSGESEGQLTDEYLPAEQADAVDVIAWLASQPWCTGSVGMLGISWGGFNALQVAARRPPALRAIVSACASDDRYADDVHYQGGCVSGLEMLSWSATMLALAATPPDLRITGAEGRDRWLARLNDVSPLVHTWLAHQRRDAYWRQGSVIENYQAIQCPTLLVGGWSDAYRNGALRLLEHLTAPARAIIGPWGHAWPDDATPGPNIGFLDEMVRWWDQWLKDKDTGVLDEPPLRAYLQDAVRPCASYVTRPGEWIGEPAWPPPNVHAQPLALGEHGLGVEDAARPVLRHRGRLRPAANAGPWCAAGRAADFAEDQQPEDGQSLAFTSDPRDTPWAIIGQPVVKLRLSADVPVALLAARLCDVWPDGASTLITRGLLNLTHINGSHAPRALRPQQMVDATLELQATAYRVPAGHRLRLALSSAYWPLAWPTPETATLEVDTAASVLEIPVRTENAAAIEPTFAAPRLPPLAPFELVSGEPRQLTTVHLATDRQTVITWPRDGPQMRLPDGTKYRSDGDDRFLIVDDELLSATATSRREFELTRGGTSVSAQAQGRMQATATAFVLDHELNVTEDGVDIFSRRWRAEIPRDHN